MTVSQAIRAERPRSQYNCSIPGNSAQRDNSVGNFEISRGYILKLNSYVQAEVG